MPTPKHPFKLVPISQEQMDDADLIKRLMVDVGPATEGADPTASLAITPAQLVELGGVSRFKTIHITSLTGGGDTALDGQATVSLSVGVIAEVMLSDELQNWKLKVDTGVVEDGVGIVVPDDSSVSNLKYWLRIS